jgi:hypothetical protein
MNSPAAKKKLMLHIIFTPPITLYWKNKIHQKMQREKLYILQITSCFVVALFVFKMNEILKHRRVSQKEWASQYF